MLVILYGCCWCDNLICIRRNAVNSVIRLPLSTANEIFLEFVEYAVCKSRVDTTTTIEVYWLISTVNRLFGDFQFFSLFAYFVRFGKIPQIGSWDPLNLNYKSRKRVGHHKFLCKSFIQAVCTLCGAHVLVFRRFKSPFYCSGK